MEHWFLLLFLSSLMILDEFDQNFWLKNVELSIFQHNLRFDLIILTLLSSELQLKYAFYSWFSYGEQNLEARKAFEPRVFQFQCHISLIMGIVLLMHFSRYCDQSSRNSSFISSYFEMLLNKWTDFITKQTSTSSELVDNNCPWGFIFETSFFDLSFVAFFKSTNGAFI